MTLWMLIAALTGAALLVVAEAACRWWVRRHSRYYVWPPGLRLDIQVDPGIFPTLEPRARFDVNTDGERGEDVAGDEAGLYRILVAGGSPVECFALDQATSWPGVLERLLNAPGALRALNARRVHVGNIGRSGVAAADLDLIFERVLPQYRSLDAIVIMVGGNDVFHWLEEGAPPSLPPAPVTPAQLFSCHPGQRFGWRRPGQWALVEVTRRLRGLWLRPVEVRRAGAWFAAARKMRSQAQEVRTTVSDPRVMLEHFEHRLRHLIGRARAHADRVLVVLQPWFEKATYTAEEAAHFWHGGVGKAWKQTISVYYSLEVVNRLMRLVDERAVHVVEELGLEHVDLRSVLTPSLRHYYDFVHYTPTGADAVAGAVAASLLRRPASTWQPPPSPPAMVVAAATLSSGSAES